MTGVNLGEPQVLLPYNEKTLKIKDIFLEEICKAFIIQMDFRLLQCGKYAESVDGIIYYLNFLNR